MGETGDTEKADLCQQIPNPFAIKAATEIVTDTKILTYFFQNIGICQEFRKSDNSRTNNSTFANSSYYIKENSNVGNTGWWWWWWL